MPTMNFRTLNYFWKKATFVNRKGKYKFRYRAWKLFFIMLFLNIKTLFLFGRTVDELGL